MNNIKKYKINLCRLTISEHRYHPSINQLPNNSIHSLNQLDLILHPYLSLKIPSIKLKEEHLVIVRQPLVMAINYNLLPKKGFLQSVTMNMIILSQKTKKKEKVIVLVKHPNKMYLLIQKKPKKYLDLEPISINIKI